MNRFLTSMRATLTNIRRRPRLLAAALPMVLMSQCAPQCAPTSGASWTAGNCASFREEAAAAGLPWSTFSPIAWRESGCNPNAWVHDSDDWGGGLFGLNFITQSLRDGWARLCGATMSNIRGNVPLQMRCAAAAYRTMGLAPWRT